MWKMTWQPESVWKLPEYTWDKERVLCQRCKYYKIREARSGVQTETCLVHRHGGKHGSCIDNRTDGPCGIVGWQFEPK